MRIFVTGASGWIGTAVVNELLSTNHQVVGLARSAVSAQKLESAGATAFHGNLQEPDALARAANECDGVIHLAFQHDLAWSGNFATAAATDRRVVEALGAVLAGSDRPFVHASGLLGMMNDRLATETDGLVPSASSRANPSSARGHGASRTLAARARRSFLGDSLSPNGSRKR